MKKSPLFTIFLVVFIDLLSFGIVIPILPYYSKSFGATAFQLGWLMGIFSIMQFLFAPLWGMLSDKIGRRPVLLATILGGACAMAAAALAGNYWLLFFARLLAGIFAANISTATAYITDITTSENRAKGMGIIGASFGLGFIFGPAIGGILSVYGYAAPVLAASVLGLANFIFAYFVLDESRKSTSSKFRKRLSRENLLIAFAHKATSVPISLFFINTLAFTQLEVIFGLYVLKKFGYDAKNAGLLLAGMGVIGATIQGGLIGKLSRRFGEANLLPMGFALLMIGMAGAAFANSIPFFMLTLVAISIGNSLENPSLSSLTSKGAPEEHRGLVMGIYQSGSSMARVIGPPAAGFLFDQVSDTSPILISSGFAAFALLLSLAYRKDLA